MNRLCAPVALLVFGAALPGGAVAQATERPKQSSSVSIRGRVAVEPGSNVPSAVGLRVSAAPMAERRFPPLSASVAYDWSFRMDGPSSVYRFSVIADRPPFVKATRITVDGIETPADVAVTLAAGTHEVVVFVAPRPAPKPLFDSTLPTHALVELFKNEKAFWPQFEIGKAIAERHDPGVLPALAGLLAHENRRTRGNAAFIFARLGDPRGFQVITDILTDRSDRPPGVTTAGRWSLQEQIRSDRYYAAHLLGDLRDPRGVPILIPLLQDKDVNSIVPWALGEIGDRRSIGHLIRTLDDTDPSTVVLAIYALETLKAKEALPRLTELLKDERKSNFGGLVSVRDAARAAIAKLQ